MKVGVYQTEAVLCSMNSFPLGQMTGKFVCEGGVVNTAHQASLWSGICPSHLLLLFWGAIVYDIQLPLVILCSTLMAQCCIEDYVSA